MRRVSDQRKMLGGCWDPILVFERESSTYVIQGGSATVRGQAKLFGEGEPQGAKRQAPEPPDTPQGVEQAGQSG
jgi:hypothetical protein